MPIISKDVSPTHWTIGIAVDVVSVLTLSDGEALVTIYPVYDGSDG